MTGRGNRHPVWLAPPECVCDARQAQAHHHRRLAYTAAVRALRLPAATPSAGAAARVAADTLAARTNALLTSPAGMPAQAMLRCWHLLQECQHKQCCTADIYSRSASTCYAALLTSFAGVPARDIMHCWHLLQECQHAICCTTDISCRSATT